jgi:hypothetical protein
MDDGSVNEYMVCIFMYVCNMKITIKPFETAVRFEYMTVKITIAFVNELKKNSLTSGITCDHPV